MKKMKVVKNNFYKQICLFMNYHPLNGCSKAVKKLIYNIH